MKIKCIVSTILLLQVFFLQKIIQVWFLNFLIKMYILNFFLDIDYVLFLGFTFLAAISTEIFGTPTIISRNCTHISIRSNLNPNTNTFDFLWFLTTFNGTSNMTVSSIFQLFVLVK